MSPELLDPDKFNAPDPRPTRESDCFALGMVIYEVCTRKIHRPPLLITQCIDRYFAGMHRMMVGLAKGLTTLYCKGFDRTNQRQRHTLDSSRNCGRFFNVAGLKSARHGQTCRLSALAWREPPRFGTSERI